MKVCQKGKGPHTYDESLRTCPECKKVAANKYASKKRQDKNWVKEQHKKYRNKEQAADYARKYRKSHPEYVKKWNSSELKSKYYQKDKETVKARSRKLYEDNREIELKKRAEYKRNNPHVVAAYTQKRRSLKRSATGSFTSQEWLQVQATQNNRCNKCGIECKLTVDHIIPLSKGGSNYISNIQGLCMPCNASKHAKIEV